MSLSLQWMTKDIGAQIVGQTRALSFASTTKEIELYQQRLASDARVVADDLLLAQRDGVAVGTATSYSMNMWIRGQSLPIQGVAWVGTIKTHRRTDGVASQLMHEMLRKGRERNQVLSALLPFRASYYDHFGYGLIERRATWTIPLSILPTGPAHGFTFITGADDTRRACRQRMVERGQCDVERAAGFWDHWTNQENDSFVVADLSEAPAMRSWFVCQHEKQNGKDILKIFDCAYDSIASLRRSLNYFATLKDQYWAISLTLPADLQLNRLLKEPQLPRIPLNHETPEIKIFTRMQARILDHARIVSALHLPDTIKGQCTLAIQGTEGTISTLRVQIESGRAIATPTTAAPDIELSDRTWSAIVLGDLSATRAADLGLIRVHTPTTPPLLDIFSKGPAPFCNEYF